MVKLTELPQAKRSLPYRVIIEDLVAELEGKVKDMESEIADIVLLYDIPNAKDVYEMSYEEYMSLSGSTRL